MRSPTPAPSIPRTLPTATATPWVQASQPPVVSPAPSPVKPASVTIRVDKEGRYFFDKEKDALPADGLTGRLRKLREALNDNLHVLIRAEHEANMAAITTAMDRAREAGIKNVAFSLAPGNKAATPEPTLVRDAFQG